MKVSNNLGSSSSPKVDPKDKITMNNPHWAYTLINTECILRLEGDQKRRSEDLEIKLSSLE